MSALRPNRAVRSIAPPLVLGLVAVGFIAWSYAYSPDSRMVPLVVGYATLVLVVLDLLSRFDNPVGHAIRVAAGADFSNLEMPNTPRPSKELVQAAWMVGAVVAVLLIGLLAAVPVYVLLSMRLNGGRSWLEAAISAAGTGLFVYVVFEFLLSYELYRGMFFDRRGLNF
jgi:hypothetical protein